MKTKKAPPRTKAPAQPAKSRVIAIVSDIHFDLHHKPSWRAFRQWHADVRPYKTVFLGDFLDLGMLSTYTQGQDDPLFAIEQIQCFVEEANALAKEAEHVTVIEGNHDNRWNKKILGPLSFAMKGAVGLTLKEQCYAQGLNRSVEYLVEDTRVRGVQCGPFLLRHGDKQNNSKFGGGKHLAANKLVKTMGESEVFGHFHKTQLFCQTHGGRTAVAVANGCMTGDHGYLLDPDWQRGFTILELYGVDYKKATAYPVLIQDGQFSYNGRVYDGTK